jgi:ABC-type uncharacterized transport system fused permease/ATPase subunit
VFTHWKRHSELVRAYAPRFESFSKDGDMNVTPTGSLVILSGPSCVGKSPLKKALGKFYPQLSGRLRKLVLLNSRASWLMFAE